MNLVITSINNKNYNYLNQITFRAKVPKDVLRKTLAEDEFITSRTKITVGEFKSVFFDKTLSLKEKIEKLKIGITSFRTWAKKLGIKSNEDKKVPKIITKEQFDKVYNLDIPEKEKYKMLGIEHFTYYKKMLEFGYTPKLTTRKKSIRNITQEEFEKVFFDDSIPDSEKHIKLGISYNSYMRKANEFHLTTAKQDIYEHVDSITKEEFDKVFFIKNLGIRHKLRMLGISEPTFLRIAQKYGYKTPKKLREEYIQSITKEQFDKVFYDKSLSNNEKQKVLGINRICYRQLAAKFGHASEICDNISITIQEFDKVFFDDTLSSKEKIKNLGVNKNDYYYLIEKFGYKTKKQKRIKEISKISKEQFLSVANDSSLSEQEKYKKLNLPQQTFLKLARKYGYTSQRILNNNKVKDITKEEFDKVFFDKNLTSLQKAEMLNISFLTYMRIVKKYGYTTQYLKNLENVDLITKEVFDEVHNQSNLTVAEKIKKLGISGVTYRKLRKQFGYTSEK